MEPIDIWLLAVVSGNTEHTNKNVWTTQFNWAQRLRVNMAEEYLGSVKHKHNPPTSKAN